ncbi:MAG: YjjG family noncanonical pyrimidine nucleotidase [Verrucomicrobia bacterium]|nr:YjjG family noncanonical pyrimidine nucleotidase [Verrucomicrobiota bacterium]MDA1065652.1 YjjG family noncanonical pyrimidine nucleotidase [Verrucomicrobiota bacterium]
MPRPRYKFILFDLDDTLLDFKASETHALKTCWETFFKDAISLEVYTSTFHFINKGVWREVESGKLKPSHVSYERARRTLKHVGLPVRNADELGALFAFCLGQVAQWLPNAEDSFRNIASRFDVGLITNGLTVVQYPRVDSMGIRPVIKAFQISEEAGTMKPKAKLFERALAEAGHSNEDTLMVGDSVSSDFQGALNAKMDFCWVKQNAHPLPLGFPKPRFHVSSLNELDSILA